jgi:aryl-alcohol dehydrogenase-like predicted oxidoreductase
VLKKDSILEECEASLRRLGVETIDLYQCHWPDKTTALEETMEALSLLLDQGKIRSIGVSNFTPEMMEECLRFAPIASDQPKYSLLERGIEKDILPFCLENHVGLIVYSPIAQGLLTGKVTMDRTFPEDDFRRGQPWFQPQNRRRVLEALDKVKPIADDHGVTLAQLAIQWTVSEPGVTSAIVGARNPKQVEENARAADFRLSDEERSTIRTVFENLCDPER